MEMTKEENVLNSIYQGAKMGSETILDLLPRAKHPQFRSDLQTQEGQYRAIEREAAAQLRQMGKSPQDIGMMKRARIWASVAGQTCFNSDTSHLAEMMILGSTAGITSMTKVLNGYTEPNPKVKGLADRLIQTETGNIDRLKTFLH